MKEKAILGTIFFIIAVFQVSFWPVVFENGWMPDFALVFLIYLSLGKKFSQNWKKAFFFGLILDIFYFQPPGINAASFCAAVFLVSSFSKRFLVSQKGQFPFVSLGLVAIISAVHLIFTNFIFLLLGLPSVFYQGGGFFVWPFLLSLLKNIFSNTACFLIFLFPFQKMFRFVEFYQRRNFQKTRFLK